MRIGRISVQGPEWAGFVDAHPDASPFHLPVWISTVADCYGFDSSILAARTGSELLAGVPVIVARTPLGAPRWVSLPFSDSCPVLLGKGVESEAVTTALRDYVFEQGVSGLEVRGSMPALEGIYPEDAGYEHKVELPSDPSALRIRKSMRNNRNVAKREGIEVTYETSTAAVEEYYQLHTLTRQRQGVPVQPHRFFRMIGERLISAGHGFVAHARRDDEILASGIYLAHNQQVVAKFGASDHERRGTGAGVLLDWEVMVRSSRDGYRILDFGRTDTDADGLRSYKEGLGATEYPLRYTRISRTPPKPHILRSNSAAAAWIIRHSPQWVCRGLGELFYRFAA